MMRGIPRAALSVNAYGESPDRGQATTPGAAGIKNTRCLLRLGRGGYPKDARSVLSLAAGSRADRRVFRLLMPRCGLWRLFEWDFDRHLIFLVFYLSGFLLFWSSDRLRF